MCSISENLIEVNKRITKAAERVGREPSEITLVSVSKTKPYDKIQEAIEAGALDFGENRVQELNDKYEFFKGSAPNIRWHQIGRLQKNKVKYLIGKCVLIHSVDSVELANEISRLSVNRGVDTDVLLQVNISEDENKGGVSPSEIYDFYETVSQMECVNVKGLMTIPEKTQDIDKLRKLFLRMNEIYIDIFGEKADNYNESYLSMGMSGDFEIAIECGANLVRVGTAIFGQR